MHVGCAILAAGGGGDACEAVAAASKNGLAACLRACFCRVGHGGGRRGDGVEVDVDGERRCVPPVVA